MPGETMELKVAVVVDDAAARRDLEEFERHAEVREHRAEMMRALSSKGGPRMARAEGPGGGIGAEAGAEGAATAARVRVLEHRVRTIMATVGGAATAAPGAALAGVAGAGAGALLKAGGATAIGAAGIGVGTLAFIESALPSLLQTWASAAGSRTIQAWTDNAMQTSTWLADKLSELTTRFSALDKVLETLYKSEAFRPERGQDLARVNEMYEALLAIDFVRGQAARAVDRLNKQNADAVRGRITRLMTRSVFEGPEGLRFGDVLNTGFGR